VGLGAEDTYRIFLTKSLSGVNRRAAPTSPCRPTSANRGHMPGMVSQPAASQREVIERTSITTKRRSHGHGSHHSTPPTGHQRAFARNQGSLRAARLVRSP
jgi:hypothetical protein